MSANEALEKVAAILLPSVIERKAVGGGTLHVCRRWPEFVAGGAGGAGGAG